MKKRIISMVVAIFLITLLFATPVQAISLNTFSRYARQQAGSEFIAGESKYHLGSWEYWRVRVYEEKSWTGVNRPEKLMGDANIDGKVDARDALVALYFGLYGNNQTLDVAWPSKTPTVIGWNSAFYSSYKEGTLEKKINSDVFCWQYCRYNSPFFADVTKDCVVNAKDALEILKYSVGKAKNFPVGDFTTISRDFRYYPWPTEYYPGIFDDLRIDMNDQEFCEKYNFELAVTPTDK